jgi:mRNA interferase RelE/StbE
VFHRLGTWRGDPLKILRTDSFKRDFGKLPKDVQERTEKALRRLVENPRHPSLRNKKMKGVEDIWEASVSISYRITYQVSGDALILRRVGTHDILRREPK